MILFWIPRDMKPMPALTTNIEFGMWLVENPHKMVLGFPKGAPSTRYLEYKANQKGIPVFHTLEETVVGVLKRMVGF